MKKLVSRLMTIPRRNKQRGAVSILGFLAVVASVAGVSIMVNSSNTAVDRANYSKFAEAVAPAALYAKLSLTAADNGNTDPEMVVRTMLNSANVDPNIQIWFGNIEDNEFIEVKDESDITAVAIKISRGYNIINHIRGEVSGTAIYGLSPDVADDDGVISTCYCQDRFAACINTENMQIGVTDDAAGQRVKAAMGEPGSEQRINYCMFGYTEAHPTAAGYSKYPNFTVFIESLGRGIQDAKGNIKPGSNYAAALMQKPLLNVVKENQFPVDTKTDIRMPALSYASQGYTPTANMKTLFGAEKPYVEGFLFNKSNAVYDKKMEVLRFNPSDRKLDETTYQNTMKAANGYDVASFKQKGKSLIINRDVTADWIWPTGYYYVGYVGTCIPGTNEVNAAKASGMHVDLFDKESTSVVKLMGTVKKERTEYTPHVATSQNEGVVQRCLSYKETIARDRDWATILGIFKIPTTSSSLTGYLQTSCVDFNREDATRITWKDWIRNNLSFKAQHRSYESFGCVKKQMTWHRSIFFAGFYES